RLGAQRFSLAALFGLAKSRLAALFAELGPSAGYGRAKSVIFARARAFGDGQFRVSNRIRTGALSHEAHLSTQQGTPKAHAWVPCSHGHQERPEGTGTAPLERPPEAATLITNASLDGPRCSLARSTGTRSHLPQELRCEGGSH